jgi:hypothetical protein
MAKTSKRQAAIQACGLRCHAGLGKLSGPTQLASEEQGDEVDELERHAFRGMEWPRILHAFRGMKPLKEAGRSRILHAF